MSLIEELKDRARAKGGRVVFPEWSDPRIAEAVARLKADGLADPVPVAETVTDEMVEAVLAVRPTKEALARRMLDRPIFRAAAMVATGEASAMVAGAETATRRVIEAASIAIGLADGVPAPSSFFLMVFPDGRTLIFSDCAVTVAPDAEGLAGIARASASTAEALFGAARVALLSYSTGTSGAGASVDMVAEAAGMLEGAGLSLTGPVQADAALNAAIAAKKGLDGMEPANTLVFPSLDAGNIGYKLCQELAGAQAVGPFLQGFRRPVCDLSRGASVDDIVAATAVSLALG